MSKGWKWRNENTSDHTTRAKNLKSASISLYYCYFTMYLYSLWPLKYTAKWWYSNHVSSNYLFDKLNFVQLKSDNKVSFVTNVLNTYKTSSLSLQWFSIAYYPILYRELSHESDCLQTIDCSLFFFVTNQRLVIASDFVPHLMTRHSTTMRRHIWR